MRRQVPVVFPLELFSLTRLARIPVTSTSTAKFSGKVVLTSSIPHCQTTCLVSCQRTIYKMIACSKLWISEKNQANSHLQSSSLYHHIKEYMSRHGQSLRYLFFRNVQCNPKQSYSLLSLKYRGLIMVNKPN